MPSDLASAALEALRPDIEAHCRRALDCPDAAMVAAGPIPGGHAGFTYRVRVAGAGLDRRLVVRIPPPGARPRGPADVGRQGRIMAALHAAGVPAPAVPVIVEAEQTRAGRPFIAMDEVAGEPVEEAGRSACSRQLLGAALAALR